MKPAQAKPLLLVAAIAVSFVLHRTGWLDRFTDLATWRAFAHDHGALASTGYVAMHTVLAGIGVPSIVFLIPAPLVFPVHEAFVMGVVGSTLGAQLAFSLARGTLRATLAPRIPRRLRSLDEKIATNGMRTVIVLRLTLFLLPPVAWALGVSKVDNRTYLVGTVLGMLPGVAFCNYVGGSFLTWLGKQPPSTFGALLAVGVLLLVVRAVRQRMAPASDDD